MDTTLGESNNVVELRPNRLTDTEGSKRAALSLTKVKREARPTEGIRVGGSCASLASLTVKPCLNPEV